MEQNNTYRTGQLLEILGVSRDALRYYEEKGILRPRQNEQNNYREYDFRDIYTLMVTDFYKKRNLTVNELKKIQAGSEIEELESLLEQKERELKEKILLHSYTLKRIEETKEFCTEIQKNLNKFSFRKMPTYKILGEISDFDALNEYHIILENMDLLKEDILSKLMRKFTFDETGYTDCKMYIVDNSDDLPYKPDEIDNTCISYSKCMYTIVEDGRSRGSDNDPKTVAFSRGMEWAKNQGVEPVGVVFIYTRLITYSESLERVFMEVYVPVKDKL